MVPDGYKVKLLTVLSIFEQKTDENNPMSADRVADEVKTRLNISCSRKGIYDDINTLNDYWYASNDPRRIEKHENGKGYYLANRPFSAGDVKLMVDAIESSKYLSEKKTLKLIKTLQRLCPETQVRDMKSQVVVFDRVKNMNEDIHESLGRISSAIAQNQQIRFRYFDYDMNKKRAYRKREHFQISVPVAVNQQFYGWVFGLGNYVSIIGPEHIKKEMAKKLEDVRKRYD